MAFEVPNLTLLRQFVVTAEERGITRAAKRLRISQPALSKSIRRLEDMLETQLFDRHSGGAELTEAGRIFFERAQVIGLEYQHALQDVRNVLSKQDSTLRIGAGPIWSSTILPKVAERFHALFPRHRLLVATGSSDDLTEDLRLGRIDIFAGAQVRSTRLPGFAARSLARSELVVLAAEDHELIRRGTQADPAEVAQYPFVAFQPSREVLDLLSAYLKARRVSPPRFMVETSSIHACVELVRTGKYLFYETRMIPQNPIGAGLAVVPLPGTIHEFDIGLVHREGLDRIQHFRRLMAIMEEVLAETVAVKI